MLVILREVAESIRLRRNNHPVCFAATPPMEGNWVSCATPSVAWELEKTLGGFIS